MPSAKPSQTDFWQDHLEKFRASGTSRGNYCREHGLKVHQLAYWLKRCAKSAPSGRAAFARVVVAETEPKVGKGQLAARLIFGSGISLEVDWGTDLAWIARLIAHVGGRP